MSDRRDAEDVPETTEDEAAVKPLEVEPTDTTGVDDDNPSSEHVQQNSRSASKRLASISTHPSNVTRRTSSFSIIKEVAETSLAVAFAITKDVLASGLIGSLVVSYWRGTWTLFDQWWCDQPQQASLLDGETFCFVSDLTSDARRETAWHSYAFGLGLTFLGVGLMWTGLWLPQRVDRDLATPVTPQRAVIRFVLVYLLGMAAVQQWRGIWYWTDYYVLPNDLLVSFWATAVVGPAVLFVLCAGASILAPPAMFLLDGPGINPPPLAVTILSSYQALTLPAQEKPPSFHWTVYVADLLISFVGAPILVVWYWRGVWGLLDSYLWEFSASQHELNVSLGTGTAIAFACLLVGSDDVMFMLPNLGKTWTQVLGRLRSLILALGAVAFWRTAWYVWDIFLVFDGSAAVSHVVGVVGLTAMGCLSSIVAPASTLGVDAVPHPDYAAEPLFSGSPVQSEALHLFGIARQPVADEMEEWEQEQERNRFRAQSMHQMRSMSASRNLGLFANAPESYAEAQRPRLEFRKHRGDCAYSTLRNKHKVQEFAFFRNR